MPSMRIASGWVVSSAPIPMSVVTTGTLNAVVNSASAPAALPLITRSEEHTSELQSHSDLVCRLLLEKKKKKKKRKTTEKNTTNHTQNNAQHTNNNEAQ